MEREHNSRVKSPNAMHNDIGSGDRESSNCIGNEPLFAAAVLRRNLSVNAAQRVFSQRAMKSD